MRRALATAAGVLLPMLGSVGAGHAQPQPTYTLRLQVIPLSDDDGGRGNTVTRNQFAGLVADANTAFAPTGIQFVWDSIVGWTPRQSTALNSMANGAGSWWVGPNQVAAQHPGRIVIFLRFGGTDSTAATNAFAYPPNTGAPVPPSAPLPTDDVNFIAFYNQSGFIPGNRSTFVHELGHYVGLFHTFPGWSDNLTDTQQKAASYMQANGGASALDGDGLADTAAEAGTAYYFNNVGNCGGPASYTISGQTFTPDRQNVMSYFGPCQPPWIFTPQQIARMRSTLQHPLRSALLQPPAPMVSAKDQPPPKATMPKAPPPRPPIPRPGTGRPVQPDPTARAVDPSLTEISSKTGPIRIEAGGTVELRATGDEMRWVRLDARGAIERVFPADSRLLQNALGDLMIVTAGGEERLGRRAHFASAPLSGEHESQPKSGAESMPVLPWTLVVATLISGAGPLHAQERTPVRAPVPVVVVSGSARSEVRASRDRNTPPAPLSAAEKAGIFGVALNLHAVQPQGLGKGIRLTPSQPFLANQGSLFFQAPVHVSARENGGYAEMEPPQATGYTGWHGSAVICAFRPTMVGQPLLIDVSIFFHPPGNAQKGKIRLRSSGMELDQTLELPKGSHHVLAIYKPADLAEKQIVVAVDRTDGMYQRFTFYACEVTPLT